MKPRFTCTTQSLMQVERLPQSIHRHADHSVFIDFGKAAFGTLLIPNPKPNPKPNSEPAPKSKPVPNASDIEQSTLIVHLGEQRCADPDDSRYRVNRKPAGTIRYIRIEQAIDPRATFTRIVIPPDPRNTGRASIPMPDEIGEVYPFRYAEIENARTLDVEAVKQSYVEYPFNDEAAAFHSSDNTLNAVWNICRDTIKATSFCGIYVDGDRERIPYEGDAYINQLCDYCLDTHYELARYTHEYLIQYPTWPTEWQMHSVMMAWADYWYSGETQSLELFYKELVSKTLIDLARSDGLISTSSEACTRSFEIRLNLYHKNYIFEHGLNDLVDWPPGSFTDGGTGERDNHDMRPINSVVNAFHCHTLRLMARIAAVLGRDEDHERFTHQSQLVEATINRLLFDPARGIYIDGEGSTHASLHSNMFMLAFELVPLERIPGVIEFVKSRGMACSVYGAQYLLEALYQQGEDQYALELMTATHDRSWWHMIKLGSTMTLEGWDLKYKNNLDWNHAWGAVPGNIIPRYLLGIRPLAAGFRKVLIQPQVGTLQRVSGRMPTLHGSVDVCHEITDDGRCALQINIPDNIEAVVELLNCSDTKLRLNGDPVTCTRKGGHLVIEVLAPGQHKLIYSKDISPAPPNT
ncbi:alpha-L-rhamnosidase [bacterium]|nr:alpha-L-rhamnosidase [bacterium]